MTPSTPTVAPTAPPTKPPRTVVTAVDAPQPRRCAAKDSNGRSLGCTATTDLWSWPGGARCRRHALEADAATYGQDAVDRRRNEAR